MSPAKQLLQLHRVSVYKKQIFLARVPVQIAFSACTSVCLSVFSKSFKVKRQTCRTFKVKCIAMEYVYIDQVTGKYG